MEVHDPGIPAVDPLQSMTTSAFHAHIIGQGVRKNGAHCEGEKVRASVQPAVSIRQAPCRMTGSFNYQQDGTEDSISSSPAADGFTPDLQQV
jgi:hypothetical protein